MNISESTHIDAPVAAVWSVLGERYDEVSIWARAVDHSQPNPDASPLNGSKVGGRICETSIGPATETLTVYEPAKHILAYDAQAESMPFFVRNLSGRWSLTAASGGTSTQFEFSADMIAPFSLFMPLLMKGKFETIIEETLHDLKSFVEGAPASDQTDARYG